MNIPNTNFTVRPMLLDDVAQIATIEQQNQYTPWSAQLFEQSLESNHLCTVIVDKIKPQSVLGYCVLQPVLDEANLLIMGVAQSQQGKGMGNHLLQHSLNGLPQKTAMVFLEVRESNTAAIKLYEKSGFNHIGLRKNYYKTANGKEHALLMALTLLFDFSASL